MHYYNSTKDTMNFRKHTTDATVRYPRHAIFRGVRKLSENCWGWGLYPNIMKIFKFVLYEPRSLLVQSDWTNKFTFSLRIIWANQIGPKVYEVRRKRILKFWNVPGMSSPHRKAFQACLVPNSTDVPGIPGPYFHQSFTHTWSPLLPMFPAYLVPPYKKAKIFYMISG